MEEVRRRKLVGLARGARCILARALRVLNATNHLVLTYPVRNFIQGTFGNILGAGDPRIRQFAVKYMF
jgi:hypothetical protein